MSIAATIEIPALLNAVRTSATPLMLPVAVLFIWLKKYLHFLARKFF